MLTGRGRDPRLGRRPARRSRSASTSSTSRSAGSSRSAARREDVFVPLAHTEGGLSARSTAARAPPPSRAGSGPYVLRDRITRASCFVCRSTEEAVSLSRWIEAHVAEMRRWLVERAEGDPTISRHAKLREVETHVVGPMCHVLWAFTTGDACGPNMMTRNALRAEHGLRPRARAGEAAAGDPRGEHGRRQEAVAPLLRARRTRQDGDRRGDALRARRSRRVLRTTVDDLLELSWAGTHGAVASGMQSVAFTPAIGDRGDLRRDRAGPRHGRDELDGARHRPPRSRAGCTARSGCPGSRSGRSAAGRRSPTRAPGSSCSAAPGAGKVYRFAQIVAAAALALEISASAAMATAGSENFFRAHHERGGLR